MRQPTLVTVSVVNLLGLDPRCQVEGTPRSFNYTNCIVSSLMGNKLSVPIGLSIHSEQESRPVHLEWFLRRKGSFEGNCAVVYVSIADGINVNLAEDAIFDMLLWNADSLEAQDFKVMRISNDGRGSFVEPEKHLSELRIERFERVHARRNGYVERGDGGQKVIRSGGSQFEITVASFGRGFLRKVGRLRLGEKVSFRPTSANGSLAAAEIRWPKPFPKPVRHSECA
jgi:hypothetical protein